MLVSPDDGWPVLRGLLDRTERSLTLGMFDLSAPHIVQKLNSLGERSNIRFSLAIQRGLAGGKMALTGEKKNDVPEEQVIENLAEIMGDRFRQAYVDVTGDDRTFASSYHIKVAVRDGQEMWLSSGNMQSSNQPDVSQPRTTKKHLSLLIVSIANGTSSSRTGHLLEYLRSICSMI